MDRRAVFAVSASFLAVSLSTSHLAAQTRLPGTIACWTTHPGRGLYLVNPDGSNVRYIAPMDDVYYGPRLSPDRTMLAYIRKVENSSDVFVCDLDGEETNITNESGPYDTASWSADGKRLLVGVSPVPTYPPRSEPDCRLSRTSCLRGK